MTSPLCEYPSETAKTYVLETQCLSRKTWQSCQSDSTWFANFMTLFMVTDVDRTLLASLLSTQSFSELVYFQGQIFSEKGQGGLYLNYILLSTSTSPSLICYVFVASALLAITETFSTGSEPDDSAALNIFGLFLWQLYPFL